MSTDTRFITNDDGNNLVDRFTDILDKSQFFDCLVGYFYVNGFYKLEDSLEDVEKIRILVGMGVDKRTFELIDKANEFVSQGELKETVKDNIIKDLDSSDDSKKVEDSVNKFVSWLESGKLEIRAYKKRSIHSKVYIMTLNSNQMDVGRVITGSSNLTAPGLIGNLEFNVELKDKSDYDEASRIFDKLWNESEDVSDDYITTITKDTWLNDTITPYELYLKFLYEYFGERIDTDITKLDERYKPDRYVQYQYQVDAVIQALNILKEHNGVFISDVVGLGKTYMGTLLIQQLKGKTLVIAPPALVDSNNPGGWDRILREFDIVPYVKSTGMLKQIVEREDLKMFSNVLIDEAHKFRNEDTQQYQYLSEICRGKKVILVSATPFNNSPNDLKNLIQLFQQHSHMSTLPNPEVHDLDTYFKNMSNRLKSVDKDDDFEEYQRVSREVTTSIRENILEHLMVRRTRNDIKKYYKDDLEKKNVTFPKVNKPKAITYEFDDDLNEIFDTSLEIITSNITFAKYTPLSDKYFKEPDERYQQSQKMMSNFIKILLVKRLESGVASFKKSIDNCVNIHQQVIETFKKDGLFITSQNYSKKVVNLLESEDFDTIETLISKGKARKYKREDFNNRFLTDLEKDLNLFEYIQKLWADVDTNDKPYPKNQKLVELLNGELKNKKVIIFTEYIDTADYLENKIKSECTEKVLNYTGKSSKEDHDKVIDNFDDNVDKSMQKNDYDILISTDVLSHGVNLHRSNIIINYDIPWNPTKIMQRVGRIDRLSTKFDEIFIYNFFPTAPIEDNIGIEALVQDKINKFISLLGNDSSLLTEEPIESYDLFNKLNGDLEDNDEIDNYLNYLAFIRSIRDDENKRELYKKIEKLPKKARVTRKGDKSLISLVKSNKFKKIIKSDNEKTFELTFMEAVNELKADENETSIFSDEEYYEYLHRNLAYFEEIMENTKIKLKKPEETLRKYVTIALTQDDLITEYEKNYLNKLLGLITQGSLMKKEINNIIKNLKGVTEPHMIYIKINEVLSDEVMNIEIIEDEKQQVKYEVLLSEYKK